MSVKGVNEMSFVDWYEYVYGDKWYESYAMMSCSYEWIEEYQAYCKENNIEPVYNG